jgi:hypothetical protein
VGHLGVEVELGRGRISQVLDAVIAGWELLSDESTQLGYDDVLVA